ncbi:TetR/AcrR family transcriptional regulator [Paenibacillus sp. S150]|uniref:TetR/AcrR family transcriptional regulator n=1 Tax=Paenibacillus sp. S150 TaxID=2749826 RepID=UPI001C57E556|nr:TetR/AcrR family transcriptional regulator [Paenibacillus sp. S150]MBW4084596.1 TetR/AcrR family transcriptional regulator C-terminal domain-containing protein [Paenibacillus sp. S150]
MDNPTNRTDPRVLRTRQLLRNAVIELLEEMDIEKISVNRIAERAKINRVTFYLHYRDIPDMLDKMADEMVEDIQQVLNNYSGLEDQEEWPLLENLLKHIGENSRFYKVILTTRQITVFSDRLFKLLSEIIVGRLEKKQSIPGIPAANIQREIAIWYGSAALIGTIVAWLRKDMPYTPSFLARQITALRSQ